MDRTYQYNFETNQNVSFNAVDYVVFGATLLASAGIGLFYAIRDRKNTDADEFLLGGRNIHYLPVSLSLLSSFISAITLLGTPAEVYLYNTMYWWISIGFLITGMGAAHIFIPIFYNLKVTSIFQYIEMRFGKINRFTASIIYLSWMMLYMAIVLYGPSLALNAVTGLSLWGSVFAVGLVTTFYTTLGGMKAVVWSDSLQMLIMFSGMLALLIAGSLKLGGLDEAWQIAARNGRTLLLEFDPDPSTRHSVWSVVIGGGIFWCCIYGVNQAQVQRAVSVSSLSNARKEEPFILYRMSYLWYSPLAVLVTVVIGLLISFITGATKTKELNPRLICPFFDVFFPCLPEKLRKKLRFGVRHGEEDVKPTGTAGKPGSDGMVNAAYLTDINESKESVPSSNTKSSSSTKYTGQEKDGRNMSSATNGTHNSNSLYPAISDHSTDL
ncbi:sodium-coupled monocarboxylate transporter 1-like isoform X2 [Argopecten irradians]|uniref:sodium-coupled monocarboxylate transporter 1-like isoform X2 n=1 Tax=Argopecten irradians TaxID=31199 RepID=UPI00371C725E